MGKLYFLLPLLLLASCAKIDFKEAGQLEKLGRYPEAAGIYEKLGLAGDDPKAAECLIRAGDLYGRKLGLCSKAVPLYERAARLYPDSKPWAAMARHGIFSCPEYFPMQEGRGWVYGDSQTKGRNMKQVVTVSGRNTFEARIYAGRKMIKRIVRVYSLRDWKLDETEKGGTPVCVLRYPYEKGKTWVSGKGRDRIAFEITDDSAEVTVTAGKFPGCLKIKQQIEGMSSWINEYYAPGIGKVLTTIAGRDFENRNMELISYEKEGQ